LTLFEHGKMVAQAISGRLGACPAELGGWLRGRWAEENMFKYDMANYGLDMLADYAADEVTNTKLKANPACATARKAETAAKTALAAAEIALAKLLADRTITAAAKNSVLIPRAQNEIGTCRQKLEAAQAERKKHRVKLPASDIDPAATRAILHINRRCLQLTLRLLAANAEHYLARHLSCLPPRRRRVPGHNPRDDHPRTRRNHHLRAQEHHRDTGPARPAPRLPRPRPAPRRDQHQPARPAGRRPAHHLHPSAITMIALSRALIAGDLGQGGQNMLGLGALADRCVPGINWAFHALASSLMSY
jgi:hypothetical protein